MTRSMQIVTGSGMPGLHRVDHRVVKDEYGLVRPSASQGIQSECQQTCRASSVSTPPCSVATRTPIRVVSYLSHLLHRGRDQHMVHRVEELLEGSSIEIVVNGAVRLHPELERYGCESQSRSHARCRTF